MDNQNLRINPYDNYSSSPTPTPSTGHRHSHSYSSPYDTHSPSRTPLSSSARHARSPSDNPFRNSSQNQSPTSAAGVGGTFTYSTPYDPPADTQPEDQYLEVHPLQVRQSKRTTRGPSSPSETIRTYVDGEEEEGRFLMGGSEDHQHQHDDSTRESYESTTVEGGGYALPSNGGHHTAQSSMTTLHDNLNQSSETLNDNLKLPSKGPFTTSFKEVPTDDRDSDDEDPFGFVNDEGKRKTKEMDASAMGSFGTNDPFPEDPTGPIEEQEFTLRALVFGCLLGAIVNCSNLYLTMKNGLNFGPGLFSAFAGFGLIKLLTKYGRKKDQPSTASMGAYPSKLRGFFKISGYFGPKENMLLVSTASAAGSMGTIYANALPTWYKLKIAGSSPSDDVARLIVIGLVTSFFGLVFAIPLRKVYILKLKLPFPTDSATAFLIRSLHATGDAAGNKRKIRWLLGVFLFCFTFKIGSSFAPGILWDWHFGYWFYKAGWKWAVNLDNWGWYFEWTPSIIGLGMLCGMNMTASFFAGALAAWALIGPLLVSSGAAIGTPLSPENPDFVTYFSMASKDPINAPSPKYWLVWPGAIILITSSLTEVLVQGKDLAKTISSTLEPVKDMLKKKKLWFRKNNNTYDEISGKERTEAIFDPMPQSERVPTWMWSSILLVAIVATCIAVPIQFKIGVGEVIFSIVIGIIFAFITADGYGRLGIPVPIGPVVAQISLSGIAKGEGASFQSGARSSLVGNLIVETANTQTCDILGTLKSAFLLSASPKIQFYGQAIGAILSVFISVLGFVVFTKAFPCINEAEPDPTCQFLVPNSQTAVAVTQAVLSSSFPVPPASGWTAIGMGVGCVAIIVVKHFWIPEKYRKYVPSTTAFGLAFVVTPFMPLAMFTGSVASAVWKLASVGSWSTLMYPVSVGMVSGEGIAGVVVAALAMAGVTGTKYGSQLACPPQGCS